MYYYFPDPPYVLLLAGLLIALTSGLAFQSSLKQQVHEWSKNRSTHSLSNIQGTLLGIPFLGITIGIGLFLSAGLEVFGFPKTMSYQLSLPLTVLIAGLVWVQLGKLLNQLEKGGSRSLDLDSL